ncbi:MAG: bifunctional UDP-N-acetylglucosamine diphosphorylase/glucosamine-1-phosphate N-acetyltransferase GlmU [Thermodesulfovibrionales bacterium]
MKLSVVVLAGGLGTRIKSETPKLLHKILNKTIIERTLDTARALNPKEIVVVINPQLNAIQDALANYDGLSFAIQQRPLGTANALHSSLPSLSHNSDWLLIINGDTPLVSHQTLSGFIEMAVESMSKVSILTFNARNPGDYGRIIRNGKQEVVSIVEKPDLTNESKHITEVNSGIYLLSRDVAPLVNEIPMNPKKGEYYLTDIVSVAVRKGMKVSAFCIGDEDELLGINTRQDLNRAISLLNTKKINALMSEGVTFIDISGVVIDSDVQIGMDTIVYPNVIIEGESVIGRGCIIYQGSYINHSVLEEGVRIKPYSVIQQSRINKYAEIGPFAHIRPQSIIGESVRIGNFVEVKKSHIGKGVKASHLSYIGDADVGQGTNIGAGTITCNYDGVNKHKTIIEDGVFIGSDTQLIAPVRIGKGAYVGAGSTITKDVPEGALAISRTSQRNISDWAKKRHTKSIKGDHSDKA